jgi:hypothetical protein
MVKKEKKNLKKDMSFDPFFGFLSVTKQMNPNEKVHLFESPLGYFHEHINLMNNSKYFAGIVMIMLNVGSKYISINLSKSTEEYFKYTLSKQLLIFSMSWMGTRDIYTSLVLTAVFVVLSDHLFNEKSDYCILTKEATKRVKDAIDTNSDGIVSHQELNSAISILERAKKEKEWQNIQRLHVANGLPR